MRGGKLLVIKGAIGPQTLTCAHAKSGGQVLFACLATTGSHLPLQRRGACLSGLVGAVHSLQPAWSVRYR